MPKLDDDTDFVMSTLWSRINSNDSIPMQLFRKSRQTLVFNKFKTCLKNSDTRKIQYYSI